VYDRTRVAHGAVEYASFTAQRHRADEDAARDRAAFSAIGAAGPVTTPAAAECSRCGNTVPMAKMTYALDGRPMCTACSATYDERAERRKIEGTSTTGFLLGFFLSVVGVWIVQKRNKPAESNGVVFGFVAGSIFLYLPAVLALLAVLRR
jgi:hypothetical protein